MATGNNENTLVKKGNDCLAIAESVCCDVNNTSIDGVEQKLKILKRDAEELASHAKEKAKEIEEVEKQYEQEILETQEKINGLRVQGDELLKQLNSRKEDFLADEQSQTAHQAGGISWLLEAVYGVMESVRSMLFGAADGSGEGASPTGEVAAESDVQSTQQEISSIQCQISDLTTQIANLNHQRQQYDAKAKEMKGAVVFFRKASQFWEEFKLAAEEADKNTELMEVVVNKAKEKEDLKWLTCSGSKELCMTFVDAWRLLETKCKECTVFKFQKITQ